MSDIRSEHKVESFVFYRSFYEALSGLRSGTKLALYEAICEYSLNGKVPKMPKSAEAYFALILPQLQANLKKREIGIANGSKGGRPPKNKPMGFSDENQRVSEEETNGFSEKNPNVNVNVNENANENANANENVNAPRGGISLEECKRFAQSEGIQCDVEAFWKFYNTPDDQGRTWMDSKGKPVTNWRQKLRTWASLEKAQPQRNAKKTRNTLNNYKDEGNSVADLNEIEFDMDEL